MCVEFLNEQQIERDTRRKENIKEKNQSSSGYSKNNKKEMDSNNNCYAVIGDSERALGCSDPFTQTSSKDLIAPINFSGEFVPINKIQKKRGCRKFRQLIQRKQIKT